MKINLVAVIFLAFLRAYSQGTVLFANFDAGTGLNAPVFMNDGITPLSGSAYTAALLAGPTDTNLILIGTTPFLSGAQAGYFNGGAQSISNVVGGGAAFILIEVWNSSVASSFAAAKASNVPNAWGWSSPPTPIITGNPAGTPATPPAVLTPLATFFLDDFLDARPVIHQSYNSISNTVTLSFTGNHLQTSTNLINWTTITNKSPQIFPLDQLHQYFRAEVN
jgi:hypothetical protein